MNEFKEITEAIIKFRNDRDWAQSHNAKNLAIDISIESSELLQAFQWKSTNAANNERKKNSQTLF